MATHHIKDMKNGSAIAKAVAFAAGQSVVNECSRQHGQHTDGDVFTSTSGALACKEIYHGILDKYGNQSEAIVKRIVKHCLERANAAGHRSVAFPAIGTGGFNYPAKLVAKWMRENIRNYKGAVSVTIVLHHSNPQAFPIFQAEFSSNTDQSASSQKASVAKSAVMYGPLTVSVMEGDITGQRVDAIVNSTNSNYDLSKGMVSKAILQQGGQGIQQELQNATNRNSGYVITSGGRLSCKEIIHLIVQPHDEKKFRKQIVDLLQNSDSRNLSSVAIPALATGSYNIDCSKVAEIMRSAIEEFIQQTPKTNSLNRLDIVVYDHNMVQAFKNCILKDSTPKKGKLRKVFEGFKNIKWPSRDADERSSVPLDIYFYGSLIDINKAIQAIENETKKVVQREVIEDPALDLFTAMENFEIEHIQKQNNIKIQNVSNKYLTRLWIVGLTKNVMKACDEIRAILSELNEAETQAQYVAWEKLSTNETWTELPSRAALRLEKAYIVGAKTKNLGKVQISEFRYNKIVSQTYDLSQMDKKSAAIRRRPKEKGETDALPSHWDDMNGRILLQVPLQKGSHEYNKVLQKMISTGLNPNNVVIERVQSVALYKQYAAKKAEVTRKLLGTGHQIEMELFHGTPNADAIINNGFDRSYAGKHAVAFGVGVYFATTARYSNTFAQLGSGSHKTMFLANVITGAYTKGQKGMRFPPLRTTMHPFDSVVNDENSPTIYVVFKDANAYPTYLIKYI